MYRVAEFEKKNAVVWSLVTVVIAVVFSKWISSLIGILVATIFTSFVLMTLANILKKTDH